MTRHISLVLAVAALAPTVGAQQRPEIRQLGPVVATSSETFGPLVFVRHLKSGVLVNDQANRRLLKLDEMLANPTVVADSTPATASAYSGRSAGLIAYRGDSSLFVDPGSMSMYLVDGDGKLGRVMSVPRSQDALALGNAPLGNATFDGQGHLVYRGFGGMRFNLGGAGAGPARAEAARRVEVAAGGGSGQIMMPALPESSAVVRVNLATRAVDTLAWVRIPRVKMDIQRDEATGNMRASAVMNPLPTVDEWAVLSDGSVAVLRGRDYHIDWIRPNGTRESSAKIPFDWQRLTDEDKVTFMDSLKAARERFLATQPAPPAPQVSSSTTTGPGGMQQRTMVAMGGPGAGAAGGNPMEMAMGRNMQFVPPEELPDYKPPFFTGAVRADADGNVWVLTVPTKAVAGGPIYDVINAKGELTERVQIPKDRTIIGFGEGGIVYLGVRNGTRTTLEKAKVR
ncbi:MAG TPA: hypothetical protein VEB19_04055 [Gemmatimonadaceae bacterium]|nr:hypothetical protein [Gemmatimonadaceae bacterium]